MKIYTLLLVLFLSSFTLQSQQIVGTYANEWLSDNGEGIEYVLTLHEEGTFTFLHKRIYLESPEKSVTVEGTWKLEGHLMTLQTNAEQATKNDIAKGLDMNTARFVSVSPRNPNFSLIQSSLKFYESRVFYAKNMELIKTEDAVTSSD